MFFKMDYLDLPAELKTYLMQATIIKGIDHEAR